LRLTRLTRMNHSNPGLAPGLTSQVSVAPVFGFASPDLWTQTLSIL
jgi:hypothetical protein